MTSLLILKIQRLPPIIAASIISGIGSLFLWVTFEAVMTYIFPPSDGSVTQPHIAIVLAGIVFILLNLPGLLITFLILYVYEVTYSILTGKFGDGIDLKTIVLLTFVINSLLLTRRFTAK